MSTKEKMIAGAADLLSRRGVHATSLRDVVQHTGTPRGSISYHFPGGKQQMLEEAVRYAADAVANPLASHLLDRGAVEGLRAFLDWWRRILEMSNFEAGCPVLAAAIEPLVPDGGESPDDAMGQVRLRQLVHRAFAHWQTLLRATLEKEGVSHDRAASLAILVIASIEGTVAMCRVARNSDSLDAVHNELSAALRLAIEQAGRGGRHAS